MGGIHGFSLSLESNYINNSCWIIKHKFDVQNDRDFVVSLAQQKVSSWDGISRRDFLIWGSTPTYDSRAYALQSVPLKKYQRINSMKKIGDEFSFKRNTIIQTQVQTLPNGTCKPDNQRVDALKILHLICTSNLTEKCISICVWN